MYDSEVWIKKDAEFPKWIRQYVSSSYYLLICMKMLYFSGGYKRSPKDPLIRRQFGQYILSGNICFIRGIMDNEEQRVIYGVCVRGHNYSDTAEEDDFYGTITDIMELEYPGMINLKIMLSKCDLYDPIIGKETQKINGGLVEVLATSKYNKYEPFILGNEVSLCVLQYIVRRSMDWESLWVCKKV